MNSSSIYWKVILAAIAFVGYVEGSCRLYEKEMGVNLTWANCKELCAQKNGSCLAWGHDMETNRCAGWILERQLETRENDTSSSDNSKGAEGIVLAQDKEEEDSEDHDARASIPSQGYSSNDREDDEAFTAEDYYAAFYNTSPRSTTSESEDDDDEYSTAEDYYAAFYNTDPGSTTSESEDDDDEESAAEDYYVAFYSTSTESASSSSGDVPSNMTSRVVPQQEIDPEIRALIEKYSSSNRGPLFDQCEINASSNFTTPVHSVNNTMSACFFQKVDLGHPIPRESCVTACQNLHSNNNTSCSAWMWRAEEEDCVGLVLTTNSSYSFCGLL